MINWRVTRGHDWRIPARCVPVLEIIEIIFLDDCVPRYTVTECAVKNITRWRVILSGYKHSIIRHLLHMLKCLISRTVNMCSAQRINGCVEDIEMWLWTMIGLVLANITWLGLSSAVRGRDNYWLNENFGKLKSWSKQQTRPWRLGLDQAFLSV